MCYNMTMPTESNDERQFHGKFDDDVTPWVRLITAYYSWSKPRFINHVVRFFVRHQNKETLDEWANYKKRLGPTELEELEPPKKGRAA